ncbi:hypothetical protein [Paracraurococcus lichenis]|uniref:Uncharacterized protein n=1 Tax=Paracraurococcus lichenis TaxID=3064888 RepID=A0ABT9EAG6_9PROT|nr:hypothetical protein [Paracraurococcus sp. LOR1-02]MDO9713178.1 hypothetical protein [Paracraurococcus sp. LOR1-02]
MRFGEEETLTAEGLPAAHLVDDLKQSSAAAPAAQSQENVFQSEQIGRVKIRARSNRLPR